MARVRHSRGIGRAGSECVNEFDSWTKTKSIHTKFWLCLAGIKKEPLILKDQSQFSVERSTGPSPAIGIHTRINIALWLWMAHSISALKLLTTTQDSHVHHTLRSVTPYMSKIFGAGIWFDLISTDDFSDWNMLMEKGHKKRLLSLFTFTRPSSASPNSLIKPELCDVS